MSNGQERTLEELKKDKERAEAEAAALEAQKKLVEARTALAAAEAAARQQAAHSDDLARLAAVKASAEARKASSDAELAAFKASVGEVPAGGLAGDVTLKADAGKVEAALLASRAVSIAAERIGKAVGPPAASPRVLIYPLAEMPKLDSWTAFGAQSALVKKAFEDAESAMPPAGGTSAHMPGLEAVPLLGAAGVTLDAASKLLGFFRSDFTVGGVDVKLEDFLLVNAVAGTLKKGQWEPHIQGQYDPGMAAAAKLTLKELADLSTSNARGKALQPRLEQAAAQLLEQAAKETDAKKKEELEKQAGAAKKAAEAWKAGSTLYEALYGKVTQPDDKGVPPLAVIVRERSLSTALSNGAKLLLVTLQVSGGAYYTKKNLWTFFGGMPLFHMGGTVATFAMLDGPTGSVDAAGVVPVHGGFVKAGNLASTLASQ